MCGNYEDYYEEHDSNESSASQTGDQFSFTDQDSDEVIIIRNSCDIDVKTTDTQASVSLQAALQLAITLVITLSIGDSNQARALSQDIFQLIGTQQTNQQKIVIENSKDVSVTTTDTDISANIQALLQVLVSLVLKLDIF